MKRLSALLVTLAAVAALSPLLVRASAPAVPSNTWAATGSMTSVRAGASATLLPDGAVLVAGGVNATGVTASVDRYTPGSGVFVAMPAMQTPRANHTATLLADGRVLVAGGTGADGRAVALVEIFDTMLNAWSPSMPMHFPRRGHTATLLPNDKVFVAGGDDDGTVHSWVETFDPETNAFALLEASLSAARTVHAAALLSDGRVMIAGGFDGSSPLASVDVFDPADSSISSAASLSVPRSGLSATTLLDGRVLIAGGAGPAGELASAEVFDPATNMFVPTENGLAAARQNHLALLLPHNNQVLIVAGSAAGSPVARAELYTPWEGVNGTFCAEAICASGYVGPSAPAAARVWATAAALSFPADLVRRSGPNDGLVIVVGGSAQSSAELYGFATITTDKEDYAPGETVTITGSGWQPGESVALVLREDPILDVHPLLDVTADANGRIVSTEFLPDQHDIGVRFYVTAYGTTAQARTTFRDGNTRLSGRVTDAATSAGIAGATVSCSAVCTGSSTTNGTGVYPPSGNFRPSFPGNGPVTLEFTASAPGYTSQTKTLFNVNNSSEYTLDFSLSLSDSTAPMVSSIVAPGTSPTNASSVQWTVTFSESVTGVDAGDFGLAASGVSGAAISNVSGSGSSYLVTAGTGSGDGTVALNVVDNDTIADAASNTLGGTGIGNGNFGGPAYVIDRTGPTVTVEKAASQADPTSASPINFTIVFSEPVNDFTQADVVLAGTGASVSALSGSGTTYTVAVGGMTASGQVTVTVGAGAAHDEAGNPSAASTSADNSVLFDETPPASVITLGPAVPNGSSGWYTTDVHVTVSATDDSNGSGVAEIRCVLDPAVPPVDFNSMPPGCVFSGAGLAVSNEGHHVVYAASVDNATNVETSVQGQMFKLDKSGPIASLTVTAGTNGSNGWYTSNVTVHTAGDDLVSGEVTCSADQFQTEETVGQSFAGLCTNAAGLVTNASPLTVKLDKTGPSATLTVTSGTLGKNGWYTSDVTVHASGEDSISGPVTCTPDATQASETTGAELTGSCTNDAGLSTDAEPFLVKLDKTGPTAALEVSAGTPGQNGWYTSNVTVSMSGTDDISGGVTCSDDQFQTDETNDATFNGSCENAAGLTTDAATLTVKLDKTAPSATLTLSTGTLGHNGWYTSDVTVHASGEDAISAPVTCTPDKTQASETTGTELTGSCTNDAGLSTDAEPFLVKLDKTGPIVTLAVTAGTPGLNGWYTSNVTVSTSGTDDISGGVTCSNDQHQTDETVGAAFNGSCENAAGLTTDASPLTVKLDKTAPTNVVLTASGTLGTNGWYISDVTIHTSGSETISGPADCYAEQFLTTDTTGQTFTGSCSNHAGLTAAAAPLTVKRDTTPPSLNPVVSPNPIVLNSTGAVSDDASDETSGVRSHGCGALTTSSVGSKTVTCTATDYAGHTSTASAAYDVRYAAATVACMGSLGHQILQPIDASGTSVFKQKSTVPAKFRVCDAAGNSIGMPGVVVGFQKILEATGTAFSDANEAVDSTTPDTTFRWSPTDQLWIFNINTKGLAANKTYLFRVSLNDNTFLDFRFGLK